MRDVAIMNLRTFADHHYTAISGLLGVVLATALLTWIVSRTDKNAAVAGDKKLLRYGTSMRMVGWILVAACLFFICAGYHASADQFTTACCVVAGFIVTTLILLLEIYFVRILFDDEFIYTYSAWRPARKIPWSAISGYAYSHFNKWHIMETNGHGRIRLSILLSGLGTFAQELEKRKIRFGRGAFRSRSSN